MNARAAVRWVASLDVVIVVVSLDVVDVILSFSAVDAVVSLGVVGAVEVSVRAEVSELSQTHEVGAAHPHHSLTAQGVSQVQQAFQVAVWGSQSVKQLAVTVRSRAQGHVRTIKTLSQEKIQTHRKVKKSVIYYDKTQIILS